jgi:SAM-dependent methyltransferase
MDNSDQIARWNAQTGARWVERQARLDAMIGVFGAQALAASGLCAGERVLDIGCGCGDTTLAIADAVGPGGEAIGVDVSAPMLAVARRRAQGRSNVRFIEADASAAPLPGGSDLLYSRFGVMFFTEPTPAFAAMRTALRPGGRVAFACWRALFENPWMMEPLKAALPLLPALAPPDPLAPGPFAFADQVRVRTILESAGFADVALAPFDAPMLVGAEVADAVLMSMEVGPLAVASAELDAARRQEIGAAVGRALSAFAGPEGVRLQGAVWIVTARAP